MVNYTFNKDKCQAERRTDVQQKSQICRQNYSIHIDTGKFTVYNKINLSQ